MATPSSLANSRSAFTSQSPCVGTPSVKNRMCWFPAAVKALAQQHTWQLWRDVVIPNRTLDRISVEEILKGLHAAPLARLPTRVRYLLRHIAVHAPFDDFE